MNSCGDLGTFGLSAATGKALMFVVSEPNWLQNIRVPHSIDNLLFFKEYYDVIKLLQFQNDLVLSLDIDCRLYSYLLGSTRTFFQISTSFTSPTFPSFHTFPTFPISPNQLATFTFFPFSYVLLSSTTYRDYLCNLIFENIHISYFLLYKDFKGTVVNQPFHSKDEGLPPKLCIQTL